MNSDQHFNSRATHWLILGVVAVVIATAFLHGNLPSLSGPFAASIPLQSDVSGGPALPELLW
jgi:hypothetical protein